MKIGSLFSGVGALDEAVRIVTGASVVWQVEQVAYRRAVLKKHFAEAACFEDVVGFSPPCDVDILCGGFPCRDISALGSKEGLDGKKSGLWCEYRRVIEHVKPRAVFIENVAQLRTRGLDRVLQDLAYLGFDVAWTTTEGRETGLYFKRARVFLLACAQSEGRGRLAAAWLRQSELQQAHDAHRRDARLAWTTDRERREDYDGPQPGLCRSTIGPARGMVARQRAARVGALGDTVSIPQAVSAYRWCLTQFADVATSVVGATLAAESLS